MKKAEPKFVSHAREFLREEGAFLSSDSNRFTLQRRVRLYNERHNTRLEVENGSARACIIGEDFVIKFDYQKSSWGNNYAELRAYKYAERNGFGHLFAEFRKVKELNRFFYVMERVYDVGKNDCWYWASADEHGVDGEDLDFVNTYFNDIHSCNYGYDEEGNIKIIDYACHCLPL